MIGVARKHLEWLEEAETPTGGGGQAPGSLEVADMKFEDAEKFMESKKFDWKKELPKLQENFELVKKRSREGWTRRKEMPVIETEDVKKFQARLEKGTIDIHKPLAKDTAPSNPFPEGLSGKAADDFLQRGLTDGSEKDDSIDVRITKVKAGDLKPIQKQIYFDKGFGATIQNGIKGTTDWIANKTFFIKSKDNYIIDGHHRWLSAMLIDPNMSVNAFEIDLPIDKLLPMSRAYGDAIGHKRNL